MRKAHGEDGIDRGRLTKALRQLEEVQPLI